MTATHLHLVLSHLPVVGVPLAAAILAWGLVRRSREALQIGLALALIIAALTYPVFLSGEAAEEPVEDAAWASETLIERHEERAEATLIVVLLTGALAAVALWRLRRDRPIRTPLPSAVLVALLTSSGLLGWTAFDGGQIRHDEIRTSVPTTLGPIEHFNEDDEKREPQDLNQTDAFAEDRTGQGEDSEL